MQTLVSKIEFAKLKNRDKSAVSRWIAEGKISRAAIIGEGLRARIWVERAEADLAIGLDPAQQSAQERPIVPSQAPPPEPGAALVGAASAAAGAPQPQDAINDDLARKRRADADRAEHDAEAARRKNAVDEGRWIEAADARRAWGQELSRLIADQETFLGNALAHELADRYGLDWKQLSVEIRSAFRSYRMTAADRAASELAEREGELAEATA